jgi:hypothetical protein
MARWPDEERPRLSGCVWLCTIVAMALPGCGASGGIVFPDSGGDAPAGADSAFLDAAAEAGTRDIPLATAEPSTRDAPHADRRLGGERHVTEFRLADKSVQKDSKPKDAKVSDKSIAKDKLPSSDKWPTPTTCASAIGRSCTTSGGECGSNATCLLTSTSKGVCTCECTLDDPATTPNEDTCPDLSKNICGEVALTSGATKNYCFAKCTPVLGSNSCDGSIACDPSSGAAVGLSGKTVCLYYGCDTASDCPVITSTTCTTTGSSCALGQLCIPITSTTTDGHCAKAGVCDAASHLCATHSLGSSTAKVGDPCADDTQCGGSMFCLMPLDRSKYYKKWGQSCSSSTECCSGTCSASLCTKALCTLDYRNGYCAIPDCIFSSTLTFRACPSGSACNRLFSTGLCQKTCTLTTASSCRGSSSDYFGDYECRSWDSLTIGGTPIASSPVCDFGTGVPCDLFQSSGLTCADVGLAPNTTQMDCRSLANAILPSGYDPTGYCLDNTASGTTIRSPMPTP